MKQLLLSVLASLSLGLTYAQTFQFRLYFEDAAGNKDTLLLGYDATASLGLDAQFGEVNIDSIAVNRELDVRFSDAQMKNGIPTFSTKKQILPDSCASYSIQVAEIDIFCRNWPVTMSWDSTLFNDQCREGSVFTSFSPGGWWDVFGGQSDAGRVVFVAKSQVVFTSNYTLSSGITFPYSYINPSQDTAAVFWTALGGQNILKLSFQKPVKEINGYPNPTTHFFQLPAEYAAPVKAYVYDAQGRKRTAQIEQGQIDVQAWPAGFYFLELYYPNGQYSLRLIKE